MDDKVPKLKYYGPILVDKREGINKGTCNYLTWLIRKMLVFHKDTISHLDFGYAIIFEFYDRTLEDVFAHDLVDLTIARKFRKDFLLCLILLHTYILFYFYIKPRSIVPCGFSWKLTDLQSSRKIGDAIRNAEKCNCGYCPPEVSVTLLDSYQTHNFSGLLTYDICSL